MAAMTTTLQNFLYAQCQVWRETLFKHYPAGSYIISAISAWNPLDCLSQVDPITRFAIILSFVILLYMILKNAIRYGKFFASLMMVFLQLALFVFALLALLFYRDTINDVAKNVASKLDL